MRIALLLLLITNVSIGQINADNQISLVPTNNYVKSVDNLTLEAAFEIHKRVTKTAALMDKKVSISLLDASGTIVLITRAEGVGPHNTEAARRRLIRHCPQKQQRLRY